MRNIIRAIFIFAVIANITACKKALDINDDPNNFTKVPAALVLPAGQVQFAYTLGGTVARITGSFVQHYAGHRNQPLEYNQYNINPSTSDGIWSGFYASSLDDLKSVIDISRVEGDSVYVGVSQIMNAEIFSILTDLYGDIPLGSALQNDKNINPAYDKQEDVYRELFQLLDAGIANLHSTVGKMPAGDDLVYAGDLEKWEKFANSLKLRLYNHLSKRDPAAALNFLNSAPALISSNDDNATIIFGESAANANPVYGFDELSGRKDMAVASTIVNTMVGLNDPRVGSYFLTVANNGNGRKGQYFGNTPGNDVDDAGENLYSREGPLYASENSPVVLMSYAEVNFIVAEIRLRNNESSAASLAYNDAVTADFEYAGLPDAAGYLIKPEVAFDNTLERLISQKWITLFQNPTEAWTDWRRTGFPLLTPAAVSLTDGVIPRRLVYPQTEINLNRSSLESGPGVPQPITTLLEKVWWDN